MWHTEAEKAAAVAAKLGMDFLLLFFRWAFFLCVVRRTNELHPFSFFHHHRHHHGKRCFSSFFIFGLTQFSSPPKKKSSSRISDYCVSVRRRKKKINFNLVNLQENSVHSCRAYRRFRLAARFKSRLQTIIIISSQQRRIEIRLVCTKTFNESSARRQNHNKC